MTTTSDKELLELAAKAAGIKDEMWLWDWWNPLTDDGDALRLAVKLHIDLQIGNGISAAEAPSHDELQCYFYCAEAHNSDPYEATRRAIVRAAAKLDETSVEIGKQL